MLNVYVGRFEASDGDIDAIFAGQYEEEWFTDDYVKTLIKSIDNSDVQTANLIISPIFGPISCEGLSGGVKTLIMLYKMPEIELWGSAMGDNCMPYVFDIASKQNITLKFSHIPELPKDAVVNFLPDNKVCHGAFNIQQEIADRL